MLRTRLEQSDQLRRSAREDAFGFGYTFKGLALAATFLGVLGFLRAISGGSVEIWEQGKRGGGAYANL